MAKLAALLFVSFVSVTPEVTTAVEINDADENPYRGFGGGGRCQEQFEMAQNLCGKLDESGEGQAFNLHHCQDFLREEARGGGFGCRRFGGGSFAGDGSRHLRYCCQQLRQLDDQCRCQGLREIVREQQVRGYGEEREDLKLLVEDLPLVCAFGHRVEQGSRGGTVKQGRRTTGAEVRKGAGEPVSLGIRGVGELVEVPQAIRSGGGRGRGRGGGQGIVLVHWGWEGTVFVSGLP
ncbi:hypothetical protein MLD38_015801 [Melastoma candidum]|uniref:Uncharacterized protein n=1 Tax=Melastoma candidum TaxID=119954 RepID=A0ACB9RKE6_9MYRT|nr:hypothetical protein MLD38_015801 [Melastoma candidum]